MFPWSSGVSQQQSLRQHSQADTLVSKYRQSSHHVSMVLATCVSASQRNPVCQLSAQPLHHLMFTFNYVYSGQHFKLNASPNYKTKSYLCQQCPLLGICVHSFFFSLQYFLNYSSSTTTCRTYLKCAHSGSPNLSLTKLSF